MKMARRQLLSVNLYNTCLVILNLQIALNYNIYSLIIIIIDVAEIVLNKCMEITGPAHEPAVKFNYDYVDDFAEPETHSNSAGIATPFVYLNKSRL